MDVAQVPLAAKFFDEPDEGLTGVHGIFLSWRREFERVDEFGTGVEAKQ